MPVTHAPQPVAAQPNHATQNIHSIHTHAAALRSVVLSGLKRVLLAPVRLTVKLIDLYLSPDPFSPEGRGVVPVTVSGPRSDCKAASLADSTRAKAGVWVLTDRRFAFVEVRNRDLPDSAAASTRERLDRLKLNVGDLPGEWPGSEELPLGPVRTEPVFELHAREYEDLGRRRMKPNGSREGVFHLLEFPDGSSVALGIDAP